MALELVLGLVGVFAFSRPRGPTARVGLPPSPGFAARVVGAGVVPESACVGFLGSPPTSSQRLRAVAAGPLPLCAVCVCAVCVCVCVGSGGSVSPPVACPLSGAWEPVPRVSFRGLTPAEKGGYPAQNPRGLVHGGTGYLQTPQNPSGPGGKTKKMILVALEEAHKTSTPTHKPKTEELRQTPQN